MESMDEFGKRLKALRDDRELTLDMVVYDIHGKFDIERSKGHLSRWENGKNYPKLIYAAYLAKYYGVSLDYLMGLTDVKTPTNLLSKKGGKAHGNSPKT